MDIGYSDSLERAIATIFLLQKISLSWLVGLLSVTSQAMTRGTGRMGWPEHGILDGKGLIGIISE